MNVITQLTGTLVASALQCILLLPFFLIAKHKKHDNFFIKGALSFLLFYIIDQLILHLPRVGFFKDLHWNWQGKMLEIIYPIIVVYGFRWLSPKAVGITSPIGRLPFVNTILLSFVYVLLITAVLP